MSEDEVKKLLQELVNQAYMNGEDLDEAQIQSIVDRHNSAPCSDFNGLSSEQMYNLEYFPFEDQCVVSLNTLTKEQYEQIPLIRQALFLLNTLGEKDLKLTNLGWLPLKIVAEMYALGQPEYIIELFEQKRINEYDAKSVQMARGILEILKWVKTRKGILSLTVKGKKALTNIDAAANDILRASLTEIGLHWLDGCDNDIIGNQGLAYSVWLLNKFGSKWHAGSFYQEHYQKVYAYPDTYNIYAARVFDRLFYWLGLVEVKENRNAAGLRNNKYLKTDLFAKVFSFKQSSK